MSLLSEKELKVLKELVNDSRRSRKVMASAVGISEPEFSKTVSKLENAGVIKKFTISIDYRKLGYPDLAIFLFSLSDKRAVNDVVGKLNSYKEIIEIQEVFGEDHDLFVRIMSENNERIREISTEITNMDGVNSDSHTFTLIFARTHKKNEGIEL
jgi:DNA-binding Lrp family transcriptional regulator